MAHPRGQKLRPAERERLRKMAASGVYRTGSDLAEAAGVSTGTGEKYLREVRDAAIEGAPAVEPPSPAEVRDTAFWRRKAAQEARRADEAQHTANELAGMASRPLSPPQWLLPGNGTQGRAAGLIHLSDLHVGEVVRGEEIGNVNAYDPEVFRRRFRRMIGAACEILPRWATDSKLEGVVVALNGDLISGDIHDELRRFNALTAHEQVALATDEIGAGIERVTETFGQVLVTVTPGNHGRTSEKPMAKRAGALSYDTMIGNMLARHFAHDNRVTVQIAAGVDIVFPIFGWNVLQTHGDAIGTGGGQGFAGPNLPILRGANKVKLSGFAMGEHYDLMLTAHFHTSSNPGRVLANGSIVGFSEYSQRLRAEPEAPQQWLGLIHEKWGLRERMPVALEDPIKPERPRVRVPAVMQ